MCSFMLGKLLEKYLGEGEEKEFATTRKWPLMNVSI